MFRKNNIKRKTQNLRTYFGNEIDVDIYDTFYIGKNREVVITKEDANGSYVDFTPINIPISSGDLLTTSTSVSLNGKVIVLGYQTKEYVVVFMANNL